MLDEIIGRLEQVSKEKVGFSDLYGAVLQERCLAPNGVVHPSTMLPEAFTVT